MSRCHIRCSLAPSDHYHRHVSSWQAHSPPDQSVISLAVCFSCATFHLFQNLSKVQYFFQIPFFSRLTDNMITSLLPQLPQKYTLPPETFSLPSVIKRIHCYFKSSTQMHVYLSPILPKLFVSYRK